MREYDHCFALNRSSNQHLSGPISNAKCVARPNDEIKDKWFTWFVLKVSLLNGNVNFPFIICLQNI